MTPNPLILWTMIGLFTGHEIQPDGRQIVIAVPGAGPQPVPDDVMDELEDKGLIEIPESGPVLTDKGRYWCVKWADKYVRQNNGRM